MRQKTGVLFVMFALGFRAVGTGQETSPSGGQEAKEALDVLATRPASEEDRRRQAIEQEIDTIVITASRRPEREFDLPRSMNVVDVQRIRERAELSIADAADDELGVWVEKRTAHTSDFVIRGLSGGNLLALVDGNTLSTFWGEGGFAGDDLYGKVDPENIERIEVIRGPASVLYGSNALGAVINFITRTSPIDFTTGGVEIGFRSRALGSTAPSLWRFREEFYGADESFRWLVGASWWDAGHTRDGSGQDQSPTGGNGVLSDGRFDWKIDEDALFTLTVQHVENEQVFRYYRPTQDNANYRTAVAAFLALDDLGWCLADTLDARIYIQHKRDERRWFSASTGAVTAEGFATWATLETGVQLTKSISDHTIIYGLDFEVTEAESPDDEQFTITPVGGTPVKAAPDTLWGSLGICAQDTWNVLDWLSLVGSLRFDAFRFESDVDDLYVPPGGLDPSVDEFTDHETALVGGLQAVFHLSEETNVFAGWTRGFRLFGPRFGVTQHGYGVVVPTPLLDPVTADQFEVGLKHRGRHFQGDLVFYRTDFGNFQNVVPGTFLGLDWYDYNGNGSEDPNEKVYVTEGNGDAFVHGVEVGARVNLALLSEDFFGESWTAGGTFMWNYGRDETNEVPIRHTHPARGTASVRYEHPDPDLGLWFEVSAEFVRHYDRIPPDRLANDVGYWEDPQVSASGKRRAWGLPGYSVFGFRAGVNLCRNATLSVGIENIFDRLYRPAHARWDAPGISFWGSLEVTF